MRTFPTAFPGELVATAGNYSVYGSVKADGTTEYEVVGPDGKSLVPPFGRQEDAMAAMTALLARVAAKDDDNALPPPSVEPSPANPSPPER